MTCSPIPTTVIPSPNFGRVPPGSPGRYGQIVRAIVLHAVPYGMAGADAAAAINRTASFVQGSHDAFHYFVEGPVIHQHVNDANTAWSFQRYSPAVAPPPFFAPPGTTWPVAALYPTDYIDTYTLNVGVSSGATGISYVDACGDLVCLLPEQTQENLVALLCCLVQQNGLTPADIWLHDQIEPGNRDFPACFSITDLRAAVDACLNTPAAICNYPPADLTQPFDDIGCQNGELVVIPSGGGVLPPPVACAPPGNQQTVLGLSTALLPIWTRAQAHLTPVANPANVFVGQMAIMTGASPAVTVPNGVACDDGHVVAIKNINPAASITVTVTLAGGGGPLVLNGTGAFGFQGECAYLMWVQALNAYIIC